MYYKAAMSLGGTVLLMLIATGAMVSGQPSMTVYISICDRLWENQTIGAEFSIELQLNLCLQYKISNKMLLMYKYLQSFYYLSVKSDALNPTLSIETLRPKFRYYLIFPN